MQAPGRAPVLVAAGGTGGHLFPAEALAAALAQRGIPVHLATDRRADALRRRLRRRQRPCHLQRDAARAQSGRAGQNRLGARRSALLQAWALIGRLKPAAVIGFGGYPTIPPVLAAAWRGVPSLIHDANAVIGRANRLLAPRVTAIATTFPDVFRDAPGLAAKATLTGNPVRPAVVAAAATPYPAAARSAAAPGFRRQPGRAHHGRNRARRDRAAGRRPARAARDRPAGARGGFAPGARGLRQALPVAAEVAPFFPDLPARMAASHLVVSRSGRVDGRRTCGHRPAGDPGAAAARARSGPIRQCRRARSAPAAPSGSCRTCSPRSGSPTRSRRLPARRSGLPPWRRRRVRSAGSMPPTGLPIWC